MTDKRIYSMNTRIPSKKIKAYLHNTSIFDYTIDRRRIDAIQIGFGIPRRSGLHLMRKYGEAYERSKCTALAKRTGSFLQ